jgi:hypothetical protein
MNRSRPLFMAESSFESKISLIGYRKHHQITPSSTNPYSLNR